MDQHELNREVAQATGETIEAVEAMGFSIMAFPPPLVVVDHRVRLGDLTRQKMRRRLKAREVPARKPEPLIKKTATGGGGGLRRRVAARMSEARELITPMPRVTKLTFEPWRA